MITAQKQLLNYVELATIMWKCYAKLFPRINQAHATSSLMIVLN